MSFKYHQHGDQSKRPESENLEAIFHQKLRVALEQCSNKGNKKREGYVMGAFREAMNEFEVTVNKKDI